METPVTKKKKTKKMKREEMEKQKTDELVDVDEAAATSAERKKKKKNIRKGEEANGEEAEFGGVQTVSIAVAGSIIDNAQSPELATRLAGQIARAATIFRINEVIVFDDKAKATASNISIWDAAEKNESGALFMARILNYLDIPQYLRRTLVPRHSDLRHAGLLPPLDAPHHARKHEWVPYREGVTLDKKSTAGGGTFVDVGLHKPVFIQQTFEPGLRVTVAMGSKRSLEDDCLRQAVDRSEPSKSMGLYWGYNVRYASNISCVFKESPYQGGYDYSIGTSERGDKISSRDLAIPKFRHLLIAFGGLAGLEENIEQDEDFMGKDATQIFSQYLNTCPDQGSRTIRTEEAIFISLQYFQDPIKRATI